MIEEPAALIVKTNTPRPSAEQVAAFTGAPTSFVVDAMMGSGAIAVAIEPLGGMVNADWQVVGPALTADNGPGDIMATLGTLSQANCIF